jgi:cell wall-associated NlpC family hydrolase
LKIKINEMKKIICNVTYIPIRNTPTHTSEQISQLIYGETASILETKEEWVKIETHFERYVGWIEKKTAIPFTKTNNTVKVIDAFARLVSLSGDSFWLSGGSEIHEDLFDSSQSTIVTINPNLNNSSITDLALQYLGTPYLWGGRTFMGIDCSGFVQVIYKCCNIILPRDASQQVHHGNVVQFVSESLPGDLAFFDNEEGLITHVGLILEPGKIIHASGSVRIDTLDQQGIFNKETGTYTHTLRVIRRLIQ